MAKPGRSSLLGVSLSNDRLAVVYARRRGGAIEVRKAFETPLSLDPLKDEPELVGREIRNFLNKQRIREKRCVVCLPLKWAFSFVTGLPELSDSDRESFLLVQAERELPLSSQDLSISACKFEEPGGAKSALVAAVSKSHLAVLLRALKSAKLRPVSLTLGVGALTDRGDRSSTGSMNLIVTNSGVELTVCAGGGIVSMRSLEEVITLERNERVFDVDLLVRQIRVTLGHIPGDLRDTVRELRIHAPAGTARALAEDLRDGVRSLGMSVATGDPALGVAVTPGLEADRARSLAPTALAAVGKGILGRTFDFEFMPAKPRKLRRIAGRSTSGLTFRLAAVGIFTVLALSVTFLAQYFYLRHLESRWGAIASTVETVETMQGSIRRFRPWFDDSARSLIIAKSLTKAFPEEGTVWAKKLSIKPDRDSDNLAKIECSGFARSNQQWLDMLDRLRETKGIEDLHFKQVQGNTPLEFTLDYNWNTGTAHDD